MRAVTLFLLQLLTGVRSKLKTVLIVIIHKWVSIINASQWEERRAFYWDLNTIWVLVFFSKLFDDNDLFDELFAGSNHIWKTQDQIWCSLYSEVKQVFGQSKNRFSSNYLFAEAILFYLGIIRPQNLLK